MLGMTIVQQMKCQKEVMFFNRLITTKEQRATKDYHILYGNLFEEELDEMETKGILKGDVVEFLDGYADVFVVSIQLCEVTNDPGYIVAICNDAVLEGQSKFSEYEFDFYGAVMNVCQSNLTKVPKLDEVLDVYGHHDLPGALDAASEWIEENRGYGEVTYEIIIDSFGQDRVLFKDKNKKLMKWVGFEDPSLDQFISLA